jgi:hypothetical protein
MLAVMIVSSFLGSSTRPRGTYSNLFVQCGFCLSDLQELDVDVEYDR